MIFDLLLGTIVVLVFLLSYFGTKHWIRTVQTLEVVDSSDSAPSRKLQTSSVPLLGGLVFSLVCGLGTIIVWLIWQNNWFGLGGLLGSNLNNQFNIGWIIVSIFVIVIGGFLDDKYRLNSKMMFFPINLALIIAVFFGNIKITSLSYPFDYFLPNIEFLHYLLAYIWIGLCLASTKFLDGHDGLVTSVGIFSLGAIATVSSFANVDQPFVFVICLVWIAGLLGFLPFNLPNAKIYLGEIGSEMIGFVIGILSIISGAKIATVSSIIGWFVLDLALVFWIRWRSGKGILEGGREHWHFRLYDAGLTKWQVLLVTLGIILLTLILGLVLPTAYKPFVVVLQVVILYLIYVLTSHQKPTQK